MPTTEPLPPKEPNYDVMARAWQEEGLGENPLPPPRMEPPPPPPPHRSVGYMPATNPCHVDLYLPLARVSAGLGAG